MPAFESFDVVGNFTIETEPISTFAPDGFTPLLINIHEGEAEDDEFELEGFFELAETSDGIDVLNESVTVALGAFSQTIPSGSFFRSDDGFEFEGDDGGITEFEISDAGEFEIEAEGLNFSDIELDNLLPFSLRIGNDLGKTEILFDD